LSDLERIVTYIALQNPSAAERMGNLLLDAALSRHKFPERGRIVPELHEIIFRSYRIIYRVNDANRSVEVIRIWRAARGFPHVPGAI